MRGAPNQGVSRVLFQDELLELARAQFRKRTFRNEHDSKESRGAVFCEEHSEDDAEGMASHLSFAVSKGTGTWARSANSLWSKRPD